MREDLRSALAIGIVLSVLTTGCTQEGAPELLQKAHVALAKGELKTAEIHLKNLLKEADSAQARLLLARTYSGNRDWQSAISESRRALDLGATPAQVAPGLLQALFHVDDLDAVLDQARKLKPDEPAAQAEVAVWTARAWMKRGFADKARVAFEDALRSVPTLVSAKVGLLSLQAQEGAEPRARSLAALDALLKDDPGSPEALLLQADLRLASGEFKTARMSLETIIRASPSDIFARSMLVAVCLELQDLSAARAHLADLLARAPKWHVAQTQMAQLNLLDGKQDLARDGALAVLNLKPDYVPALAIAGSTSLAQGSSEQAESYARQMIKLAPTLTNGHRLLAAALLKRGEAGRAIRVLEPLVQRDPSDAGLLVMAGEASLQEGNASASAKYFARAVDLDKTDPGKRVALARARMGMGDRAGALEDLQTATLIGSESTAADQLLVGTLISDRKFDHALEAITRLEKKAAGASEASFLRGRVALAQGDEPGARRHFSQALLVDSKSLAAAASLAALDAKEGKTADARRRYETVVAADPTSAPALLGLAKVTAETAGSAQDVLGLLRRAHAADPSSEPAALSLAEALLALGEPRAAIEVLQKSLKLNPGWIRAQEALAGALVRVGEPDRAQETIDRLARLRADDAGLQFRMGTLKASLKDYRGALERYQRAQALEPKAIEPRAGVAQAQALLGRFDEAFATVHRLQKDHPGNPAGWALEADLYRARQKWPEAAKALRKALAIEPGQRTHAMKLHDSLSKAGSTGEADRLLKGWLEASPQDEKLNLYAGEGQLARKNYAEAVRHYDVAVAANAGNAIAYNNLAWALYQLRDPRAVAAGEEAYRLAPNSAAVVDTLATILSESDKVQRGLELHKRAAMLAPHSAEFRLKLAKAFQASGNKVEAKRELDLIASDFPDSAQATTARQLIGEL